MKTLAAALALVLAFPTVAAQGSDPEYPAEFLALLPGWIAEAEALVESDARERPWWPEAEAFLQKAKDAQESRRFRITLFQLETFTELVVSNQLVDQANATHASDAERKSFVIARLGGMRADSETAWADFREALRGYDDELRSLHSIEKALYAGDIAATGAMMIAGYDAVASELPKQPGVPMGYVLALVRAAYTSQLNIGWAADVLAEGVKQEGLPPRVIDETWANLTAAALAVPEGETPDYLETIAKLGDESRANDEALMAIVFSLAEQRSTRAYGMQTIFGDGQSRNKNVVGDSARGMNKQLNNTTLEEPRSYGLLGVFTSDGIDRARYSNEFYEQGIADLGTIIIGWTALEHARFANAALASVSGIAPPAPTAGKEAPFLPLAALVGAMVVLALVRRRA